jgi:ABC-type uncharacterized transport system substrate-binding protein
VHDAVRPAGERRLLVLLHDRVGGLPVAFLEQADRFVTVLNRSTAKALGITIPESVRLRVDEVIE